MRKFIDKSLLGIGEGKTRISLFALALPIFLENIGVHLIGMIQSALAARYHDGFFVTPMNIANNTASLILNIVAMISTGMTILLSIYIGRREETACKTVVGTSLVAMTALRIIVFCIAFLLAEPLISLQGLMTESNAEMFPHAVGYFRGLCVIYSFTGLTAIFSGALRCYGVSSVGFIASIASSIVTLVLTYLVFYVAVTPESQAISRFIAISAIANASAALVCVVGFFRRKIPIKIGFDFAYLKKMFKVGFPATVSMIMYSLSTVIAGAICVYLSNDMFLAKTYATSIVYFTNIFGYSVGQANAIMVGRGCGMGDFGFVDRAFKQNLKITLTSNLILSVIVAFTGKFLLRLYTDSPSVLAIGSAVFVIDVFVEFGRGMNHLGQFGLNATGDTMYTTIVSVVSCWVCSVGIGYVLGVVAGLGIYGIWAASAVDELFRGTLYMIRWRKGRWENSFLKEQKVLG